MKNNHSFFLSSMLECFRVVRNIKFMEENEMYNMSGISLEEIKKLKGAYYNKTLTEYFKKLDESAKRKLIVYLSDKPSKESAIYISLLKASIDINKEQNNTGLHL